MTSLEDELRVSLRTQAQALRVPKRPALDRDIVELHRRPGPRWLAVAACLALIVSGVVALAQRRPGDPEPAPPVASVIPETTAAPAPTVTSVVPEVRAASASAKNGWVAVESENAGGRDIYLIRPGEDARRIEVAESDTVDEACPAWSPDGTRLLFGRVTLPEGANTDLVVQEGASDAELVIVPVAEDGEAGAPTVIALDNFDVLDGFGPHPCGIWAPDGRWVALAGRGDVWVVDTQTGEIRRLPDLRPVDLDWRPGTDELAIAGDVGTTGTAEWSSAPVSVYSVATGELRQLGSVEAVNITWSPDGSTLAYTGDRPGLWLVDADSGDRRLLTADTGSANHGIGPVWSPKGDRIVYQRIFSGTERHLVVLVSVADGSETVIESLQSDPSGETVRWFPYGVTWSPDGTTLLYQAWSTPLGSATNSRATMVVVPADTPIDLMVLDDSIDDGREYGWTYTQRWIGIQMWGRQPG
jgi:Tol biopolymer transport system component